MNMREWVCIDRRQHQWQGTNTSTIWNWSHQPYRTWSDVTYYILSICFWFSSGEHQYRFFSVWFFFHLENPSTAVLFEITKKTCWVSKIMHGNLTFVNLGDISFCSYFQMAIANCLHAIKRTPITQTSVRFYELRVDCKIPQKTNGSRNLKKKLVVREEWMDEWKNEWM